MNNYQFWINLKDFYESFGIKHNDNEFLLSLCKQKACECEINALNDIPYTY